MKETLHILKHLFASFALLLLLSGILSIPAKAAEQSASISVNRASGECTYTVQGLNPQETGTITLHVSKKDTNAISYTKEISLSDTNCINGSFTDRFTLDTLGGEYATYSVDILVGGSTVSAGICDFSLHTDKLSLVINGEAGDAARTAVITSTEAAGEVVIPGTGKKVSVLAWMEQSNETSAKAVTSSIDFTEGGMSLPVDLTNTDKLYGTWHAKLVLEDPKGGTPQTLATTTFNKTPTFTSFTVTKSKALEKKQSFSITLDGLKNAHGISAAHFTIYDSKNREVLTISGTKKKSNGSKFSATVTMKKLKYKLDNYKISASIADSAGNMYRLNADAYADCTAHGGSLSVTKKGNATCTYKLTNPYIPGNIQKVSFVVYQKKGSKYKKLDSYTVKNTAGKTKISFKAKNEDTGRFKVLVYGYTAWGKKLLLNEETYRLLKKDMGKNGWYYEKYAGKTYKFYYINNEKQTDLTKLLKIKESNATNTNKFYIEINRAASAVTIFMYNDETKKYDIPIKTCAVSVGSDTWTNLGTSGLNEKSSYTPLGTYSICTNGTSVKYSVKEMHEPDGKILYARWTSHIVGNVYFHSIAVSRNSHYALSPYTYNRLGSPASAGCIRMMVADAKWIYDYASTGSIVKVNKGNAKKPGPLGKAPTIKVQAGINYDPSDPGVPDSLKKKDYKAKKISGYITKSGKRVGF